MQIVIPMSGYGERFRRAGYSMPKPLIEIEGKPIIAYVIEMFPGEEDFIFICNNDHLDNPAYRMQETLQKYCPTGRIAGIPPHKLGPIHAVREIENLLNLSQPTVVNYCDFTCYWDWHHFKRFLENTACDGCIPAYKGFHPHSLGNTNYAYMKEESGWVQDIQEKQPYTNNRLEEYASSGTYFFASGQLMGDAFRSAMEEDLNVNGEYYVSLAYKYLLRNKYAVAVYPLQHFMQWGTPEDVEEYCRWSAVFNSLNSPPNASPDASGALVIPMAGLGQRFAKEGYSVTKPLIPVSGKPMAIQAIKDLPPAKYQAFVLRQDMAGHQEFVGTIKESYPLAVIENIPNVTDGQASTALIGLDALEREFGDNLGPVTFGACDNGVLYNAEEFARVVTDPDVDVIVWGVRGHPNAVRHPQMFGWIDVEPSNRIKSISVKTQLASPASDPIVIGTFTFKEAANFRKSVELLIFREGRINGEFYIDSCINDAIAMGLNCYFFEVDSYLSWGTPNELRTFEYWQSCFNKWSGHPYRLENDADIPFEALVQIQMRYMAITPEELVKQND